MDPLRRRVGVPGGGIGPWAAATLGPPAASSAAQSPSRAGRRVATAAVAVRKRAADLGERRRGGPSRRSRTSRRCTRSRRGRRVVARPSAPPAGRSAVPSTGASTASASFGHAASRIAAPGSSILPSPFRSSRDAPRDAPMRRPAPASSRRARGFGAAPSASTVSTRGQTSTARRSCVADLFIVRDDVDDRASSQPCRFRERSKTRWIGPYAKLSSAATRIRGRLVVPVDERAARRVDRLRMRVGARKPVQS